MSLEDVRGKVDPGGGEEDTAVPGHEVDGFKLFLAQFGDGVRTGVREEGLLDEGAVGEPVLVSDPVRAGEIRSVS